MKPSKETVAVDLDATLAHYDGFKGKDHIGAPVPEMLQRVKDWLAAGTKVVIFTARADRPENIPPIRAWLKEHLGQVLPVTNVKRPEFGKIYDDRAVTVQKNTGKILTAAKRARKMAAPLSA